MTEATVAAPPEFTGSIPRSRPDALSEEMSAVDVLARSLNKSLALETDEQVC